MGIRCGSSTRWLCSRLIIHLVSKVGDRRSDLLGARDVRVELNVDAVAIRIDLNITDPCPVKEAQRDALLAAATGQSGGY